MCFIFVFHWSTSGKFIALQSVLCPALQIRSDLQLPRCICRRHVPNLSKNWSFGTPSAIMSPENPEDSGVGIGVSTIQCPPIIESNHPLSSLLWRWGPFENSLPPKHSEIIVNNSQSSQLSLSSVPQFIISLCRFQLLKSII